MTIQQIEYVLAVAESRSINSASKTLFISQSRLSGAIRAAVFCIYIRKVIVARRLNRSICDRHSVRRKDRIFMIGMKNEKYNVTGLIPFAKIKPDVLHPDDLSCSRHLKIDGFIG